jgi:hypothetical protein
MYYLRRLCDWVVTVSSEALKVVAIKVLERRNFGREVATAESGKEDLRKHVAAERK